MRKIVVMYCAEEKNNNMNVAERLVYELANDILVTTNGNAITMAERITPEIARVQFKLGSEIILYPIKEYGLYGMKFTDIYIDDDLQHTMDDARMFSLTKVLPSLLDDNMCKSIYKYDVPVEKRFKAWKITDDGFKFREFMKNYEHIDGDKNGED